MRLQKDGFGQFFKECPVDFGGMNLFRRGHLAFRIENLPLEEIIELSRNKSE